MIEEVAVVIVAVVVVDAAELLAAPEEDHAEVVVEAEAAPERRQVGVAVRLLKDLERVCPRSGFSVLTRPLPGNAHLNSELR